MKFEDLRNSMSDYNKVYGPRFNLGSDGVSLKIGTFNHVFNFTKNDYKDAEDFINKFSMFKPNEECLGDELYYKGLRWTELTEEQKQSVINSYKDDKHFVTDPSKYDGLFNNNRSFLEYII